MGFRILLLLIFLSFPSSIMVNAEEPLTAAFIRDHQLWIKKGEDETQITKGRYVYSPKWSYDGRFLAYLDGDEHGKKSDLYIFDTVEKESYQPYMRVVTSDFKWAPNQNQLAYTDQGLLNVTKTKNGRPEGFENVALGVSGFEWFPDGNEFIVSSEASLRPTGWGPVPLYKVPVHANLAQEKIEDFYMIQTNEPDLFAITADYFTFSSDGKWMSFLAIPTASWSMDSNTLCVLSSKGEKFQVIDNMLGFEKWIEWAPSTNQLAYISGEGRFFVENKRTSIVDIPIFKQHQKQYTPKGYVDLDLAWFSQDNVIVARAEENKEWEEGPVPTMFTALYNINVKTEEQHQITFPAMNAMDKNPQIIGSYLTWFRKTKNNVQGDVWLKAGLSGQESIWLTNIDDAPIFFLN
ncbi:hypothetical protein JCM9140_3952 [Halalkalibacter wakoensis JCM 9140]|uniref:Translocation protein TolB n=1 Tax=Halalkalibacter wakoensis JCM 9140 TaxID=1236970 RepID=W4Q7W4_9BACI|nr:hypothetical protein [Halalkalibacter wakoensis]GAE27793.1 hypothetical protein JCM9140_3952 [Halalkalibacter wakoensis JCM 9140]